MTGRIAVTGSSGHLGRAVVEDLLAHSYDVVGIDRTAVSDGPVTTHVWDGRSVEAIAAWLDGCDALIHLAAIPAPLGHPPEVVFTNNTQATFAALEAAGSVGVRRVAIASSGSAYGTAWSPQPTRARYVPIDEDHPMINFDPYGLSKEVDERTAAVMARRFSMSVAALRFHWIATRSEQLDGDRDSAACGRAGLGRRAPQPVGIRRSARCGVGLSAGDRGGRREAVRVRADEHRRGRLAG